MAASRHSSVTALLGGLLAASGCSAERNTGGGDSPALVQRAPEVSTSRAERSLPLTALPSNPTQPPTPGDSLLEFPPTSVNFVGQGTTLEGCTFPNPPATCTSAGAPPYPSGAAGPNHYVQVVNGGIAIWNKTGALILPSRQLSMLWYQYNGSAGNRCFAQNDGQATVLYDRFANRWFIAQLSLPNLAQNASPSFVCLAVSQTSDPTGPYYLYDFGYTVVVNDYPQFGFWRDGVYASFNNYGATSLIGANVCAIDERSMVSGQSASQQCFLIPSPVLGVLPATLAGPVPPATGAPGLFLNVDTAGGKLNLWKLHADFTMPANSTLTGPTGIAVDAFSPTCGSAAACVPQPSPGNPLAPVSDRLMPPVVYRNFGAHESLLTNHSVAAGTAGGVRWYELRAPLATPTVFQQGTYAPTDGSWGFMGSMSQDGGGDIALGFTLSSATIKPSLASTGRLASDPAGTMAQGESVIAAGGGVETGTIAGGGAANRWGAWSSMSLDPADDCTFWFTSELYPANGIYNWDTRIAAFKFPGCGANDFSLDVPSGGQLVPQGSSVDFTISTAVTKGNAETIAFGVQDLRAGLTAVITPPSVTAGRGANLRVTASPTATVDFLDRQAWFFRVIGSSPSAVHVSTSVAIQVTDCKPSVTTCPAAYDCGLIGNGCQGYISCGADCAPPKICGGGGTPNVCGGVAGTGGGGGGGGGGGTGGGGRGGGGSSGAGGGGTTGNAGRGGSGGVSGSAGAIGGGGGATGGGATGGGAPGIAGSGTGRGGATASGTAGASGRGGEAGAAAGSTGRGGQAGTFLPSGGGCGCGTPGTPAGGAPLVGLGLALAALRRLRRRPMRPEGSITRSTISRASIVALLAVTVTAACGSNESKSGAGGRGGATGGSGIGGQSGGGGSGGVAGSLGNAGTTGVAGNAGTTGSAGNPGTTGVAGAGNRGAGGTGGAAGMGGAGGMDFLCGSSLRCQIHTEYCFILTGPPPTPSIARCSPLPSSCQPTPSCACLTAVSNCFGSADSGLTLTVQE